MALHKFALAAKPKYDPDPFGANSTLYFSENPPRAEDWQEGVSLAELLEIGGDVPVFVDILSSETGAPTDELSKIYTFAYNTDGYGPQVRGRRGRDRVSLIIDEGPHDEGPHGWRYAIEAKGRYDMETLATECPGILDTVFVLGDKEANAADEKAEQLGRELAGDLFSYYEFYAEAAGEVEPEEVGDSDLEDATNGFDGMVCSASFPNQEDTDTPEGDVDDQYKPDSDPDDPSLARESRVEEVIAEIKSTLETELADYGATIDASEHVSEGAQEIDTFSVYVSGEFSKPQPEEDARVKLQSAAAALEGKGIAVDSDPVLLTR